MYQKQSTVFVQWHVLHPWLGPMKDKFYSHTTTCTTTCTVFLLIIPNRTSSTEYGSSWFLQHNDNHLHKYCYNPKGNLNSHCRKNLKPHVLWLVYSISYILFLKCSGFMNCYFKHFLYIILILLALYYVNSMLISGINNNWWAELTGMFVTSSTSEQNTTPIYTGTIFQMWWNLILTHYLAKIFWCFLHFTVVTFGILGIILLSHICNECLTLKCTRRFEPRALHDLVALTGSWEYRPMFNLYKIRKTR